MRLFGPTHPPFDLAQWATKPFAERVRMAVQSFGLIGNGPPLIIYLFYAIKLAWYFAMWVFFCSFTEGLGHTSSASWVMHPIAFQKAVAWTMLYEVMGFGCGSGPLSGRFSPMVAAYRHWLRPGTTKLPYFEGAPLIGGHRRTGLDALLYFALLVFLILALIAPEPGRDHWLPIVVLVPILGILDKPIFLAARAEHYWVMMVAFVFADNWIAAAMAVQLALWFFAGISKLNSYFPTVVAVMTSNSPFTPFERLRKSMYADYPDDMRPSKVARMHATGGTVMELTVPCVFVAALVLQDPTLMLVALGLMLALHGFILSNVPLGVPIEWNFMVPYGGFFLFYQHPTVTPLDVGSLPVSAFLVLTCLIIPIAGNLFPSKISFLLAMRYYAGNWPVSLYLFKGDSLKRLDRLTKSGVWLGDALLKYKPNMSKDVLQFTLFSALAFRMLHLHGRAIHSLIPQAVDNMDEYTWADGEVIAGLALGWNFGDGHLHHEQFVRALQAQCEFEEGELRCIFLEAQPLLGSTQEYRLYDAKTGEIGAGEFPVSKMRELQPWPAG